MAAPFKFRVTESGRGQYHSSSVPLPRSCTALCQSWLESTGNPQFQGHAGEFCLTQVRQGDSELGKLGVDRAVGEGLARSWEDPAGPAGFSHALIPHCQPGLSEPVHSPHKHCVIAWFGLRSGVWVGGCFFFIKRLEWDCGRWNSAGGVASENVLTGPPLSAPNTCFRYLLPHIQALLSSSDTINIPLLPRLQEWLHEKMWGWEWEEVGDQDFDSLSSTKWSFNKFLTSPWALVF